MEALLAVGLAGNVVQFVQLAGKLISETNAIRKTGNPSSLQDLQNLSESLTKQAGAVKTHLEASNAVLSQEDQYLLDVASDCQNAGTQFLAYLDALIDKSASSNPFRSAKASIKFHWVHHKIEDFASKLDKLRSALTLATTLALRASANDYNDKILAHVKALKQADQTHGAENAETIAAIQSLVDNVQQQPRLGFDTIQAQIQGCLKTIESLRQGLPQTGERAILAWLNFRQMSWRYEDVPLAYQKTFQWIFQKPSSDRGWDDFTTHLTGINITAPYFINGKAGSGKSTLMKFIIDHSKTKDALIEWANTEELLVVKFFFWNLGTPMQKSTVGMLRALIHGILERYQELIPAVFPSLYQGWENLDIDIEPTYMELKKAFELLKEKSSSFLKLCIFIDGIDEFEGDHRDISLFLRGLASTQVKLIVSSRPINACLNALHGCPTLGLQDLTRHDMEMFIQGELSSHRLMVGLTRRFPRDVRQLVTEIKDKAEGVFLWVKLVVRLLVDGLEAGDDMIDLQLKLRSLPSDLKDLYRRMIGKIQPEYQTQAAEMFQLNHTWNTLIEEQPLRALVLSFAVRFPSNVFSSPVAPLEPETFIWLSQTIEARIRSRCCGLLELHNKTLDWISGSNACSISVDEANGSVVSYLHRTVAEFLTSDDVWNEICAMTKDSGFDPVLNLASACLSMMKAASNFTDPALLLYLRYTTKFCRQATKISDRTLQQYVATIDETMNLHRYKMYVEESVKPSGVNVHWSADLYCVSTDPSAQKKLCELASILTFAARNGLVRYMKAFYHNHRIEYHSRFALVVYAMESWRDSRLNSQTPMIPQDISLHERAQTLLFLLQNLAKPEDEAFGISLWSFAVRLGHELSTSGRLVDLAELLRIFLSTAQSRRALVNQPVVEGDFGTVNFSTLIGALWNSTDTEINSLGLELARLISSDAPCFSVSDYFIQTVSKPPATNGRPRRKLAKELECPGAPLVTTGQIWYDDQREDRSKSHYGAQIGTFNPYLPPPMGPTNGGFNVPHACLTNIIEPALYQQSLPDYDPAFASQAFNAPSAILPGTFFSPGGYGWQHAPAAYNGFPQSQPFSAEYRPLVPGGASAFANATPGKPPRRNHHKSKKPPRVQEIRKR
ncbi:MAG: hypothetical protein M1813_008621 [Trichoglossum hirsutum]|nr:MAG: hypothetical protein M1813_008621 [Trichoglossum hirsutum]